MPIRRPRVSWQLRPIGVAYLTNTPRLGDIEQPPPRANDTIDECMTRRKSSHAQNPPRSGGTWPALHAQRMIQKESSTSSVRQALLQQQPEPHYLSRRASRSHSSKVRMSPCRMGPFTLRTMVRSLSSRNSTRTCVTPPVVPVRPSTLQQVRRSEKGGGSGGV